MKIKQVIHYFNKYAAAKAIAKYVAGFKKQQAKKEKVKQKKVQMAHSLEEVKLD